MKSLALTALLALTAMSVHARSKAANIKSPLPCRFQAGMVSGTFDRPKEFAASSRALETMKTSLGKLEWSYDASYQTIPVINGKQTSFSKENKGLFGVGKVYDLGGKLLLAYQVERMEDSRASPSIIYLLVGSGGKVIDEYLVAGEGAWEQPCNLLE